VAFSVAVVRAADAIDEKQFQKHMKSVGKAAKEFKGNFEGKKAEAIEKDATTVAEAYKAMATLFKARNADDAVKLSEDSATAATATAAAAKAGEWDKVKSSWATVSQNCKSCHDKHRQKLDDGSYKIK
jgi:cytochrome c556